MCDTIRYGLTSEIIDQYILHFSKTLGNWDTQLPLTRNPETNDFKLKRSVSLDHFSTFMEQFKSDSISVRKHSKSVVVYHENKRLFRISIGDGSRNRSSGGISGKQFEKDICEMISNKVDNDITRKLSRITRRYSVELFDSIPTLVGNRNSKRKLKFHDSEFHMESSGSVISDLDVCYGDKKLHLSIKNSPRHYLCNMSLREYFVDGCDSSERDQILQHIGFSPRQLLSFYGIYSKQEYVLNKNQLKKNWEQLLSGVIGSGYVHVEGTSCDVLDYHNPPKISVNKFWEPVYAQDGVRKYSKINLHVNIGDHQKIIECQLRGTDVNDKYPYYMRICVR